MKRVFLAVVLLATAAASFAATCGIPPIPPIGCQMFCQCDQNGNNCQWFTLCR